MKQILVYVFLITLFGCNKVELDKEKSLNSEFRTFTSLDAVDLNKYSSLNTDHEKVAKILSDYFKDSDVRLAFNNYRQSKGNDVILLGDFIYNKILDNTSLTNKFSNSIDNFVTNSNIDLDYFINDYLKAHPNLEISFIVDGDPNILDNQINSNFEVVVVYSNIDTYPIFKNGLEIGNYTITDEPANKLILKLQKNDIYSVFNNYMITNNYINNKFTDLLNCDSLRNYLWNLADIIGSSKIYGTNTLENPYQGMKILSYDDIFNIYNKNCGDSIINDTIPETEFRTDCARDDIINGDELITDVRGINGKTIFRSCDKWCSYWDKNCVFQVDVFIPTIKSETEFDVLGSITKVFSLNEKRLRKGWNTIRDIPVTEWQYLEGKHGDEWQYTWTGRHRKRGTTEEISTSNGFSAKIKFITGSDETGKSETEFGITSSVSLKITKANEDCPLGSDIARYCSSLREQMHLGDIDFKLDEAVN